jgi:quercetin dioxygenase-like cupin family protein
MHRLIRPMLSLLVALVLVGGISLHTGAQDKDPFAGTVIESLGSVSPSILPDHTMNLVKVTMDPGATIAFHHHPGPVVIAVQSGEFTTSFEVATGVLNRAATKDAEAKTEPLQSGVKYVLKPGDSIAYDADAMGHYMANEGTEPLVLLATVLWVTDEDGFIFEDASTPVAGS